jgi:hypothetical protein
MVHVALPVLEEMSVTRVAAFVSACEVSIPSPLHIQTQSLRWTVPETLLP